MSKNKDDALFFGSIVISILALLGTVLVIAGAAGCGAVNIIEPIPGPDRCPEACQQMQILGCDAGEGSPGVDEQYGTADDISCAVVCLETENAGIDYHTACIVSAGSCEAAEACFY